MRRLLIISLALIVLTAAALLWSGAGKVERADFVFVNRGDIKTLDLVRMSYLQDIRLAYGLWEGLYRLNPKTLEAEPGCAFPIEISPDHRVYTFHIRPQAKWSNNDPVTADDFIFAWKRMCDEAGDYAELLDYIRGIKEYQAALAAAKPADFSKVGVEKLDDRTLRVTLVDPIPFFPDLCAFPPLFPCNRRSMIGDDGKVMADFTRPPHLVSNGPYFLKEWQFKRRVRLEASPYYWDRDNVKSKTIDMLVIDRPQTQLAAYDTGAIDWISDMSGEFGAKLREAHRPDLHVFSGFGTYFYSFNCEPKLPDGQPNPFHDVAVRRAFSMAIDKTPIVDNLTRMGEPVATTYIPPGVFKGYQSPAGLPFDVARAQALLASAGYPGGRGFPKLKINFNNEGTHKDIAEYIQRQWHDNLGVETILDGKELKLFGEQLRHKQYAISRASWIGDYNDPSTFTDKYISTSGNNDSDWQNPKYDALCAAAAAESDPAKRLALFHQAEQILLNEAPILPLYHYVNSYMFRPSVTGLPLNPRGMVMLQSVRVGH